MRSPAPTEAAPSATPARGRQRAPAKDRRDEHDARARRDTALAVVTVVAIALLGALVGVDARATYGASTSADEPYYLLTALSLAEDRDLDLRDELADRAYEPFHEITLDEQTVALDASGRRVAPHDPLLPVLLAPAMRLGPEIAWRAAKATLALLAALLAGLTTWVAVRRLGVRPWRAALVVGGLAAAMPLASYGTQVYPEVPAALAVMTIVALAMSPRLLASTDPRRTDRTSSVAASTALGTVAVAPWPAGRSASNSTSDARRPPPSSLTTAGAGSVNQRPVWPLVVGVVAAIMALPWLSVKYVPVAAVLTLVVGRRAWAGGHRRLVLGAGGVLALAGIAYLVAHQAWYGGWTVYAAGDHFVETGELSVVGTRPNPLGRARRLVGLLVDRDFGLAAWTPAWLLVPAAVAWFATRARTSTAATPAPAADVVDGAHEHRVPARAQLAGSTPAARPPRRPLLLAAVRRAGRCVDSTQDTRWLLLAPLAAGWLTATFVALTMHGWWMPGRQVVVVAPLAVLALATWVDTWRSPVALVALGVALLAGAANWLVAAREAITGGPVLIVDLAESAAPARRLLAPLLPDGRDAAVVDDVRLVAWAVVLVASALAAATLAVAGRRRRAARRGAARATGEAGPAATAAVLRPGENRVRPRAPSTQDLDNTPIARTSERSTS